jgi:hypothetical protein
MSITPNTVTLDCACAAPLPASASADPIKNLFMFSCLLLLLLVEKLGNARRAAPPGARGVAHRLAKAGVKKV